MGLHQVTVLFQPFEDLLHLGIQLVALGAKEAVRGQPLQALAQALVVFALGAEFGGLEHVARGGQGVAAQRFLHQLQPLQHGQQAVERIGELARELLPGGVVELPPSQEVDAGILVAGQPPVERAQVGVDGLAGLFVGQVAVGVLFTDGADEVAGQQAFEQGAVFDHALTSCWRCLIFCASALRRGSIRLS